MDMHAVTKLTEKTVLRIFASHLLLECCLEFNSFTIYHIKFEMLGSNLERRSCSLISIKARWLTLRIQICQSVIVVIKRQRVFSG